MCFLPLNRHVRQLAAGVHVDGHFRTGDILQNLQEWCQPLSTFTEWINYSHDVVREVAATALQVNGAGHDNITIQTMLLKNNQPLCKTKARDISGSYNMSPAAKHM